MFVRPSVCPSVNQLVSDYNLEKSFYLITFIVHMLICLGEDKNPVYFGFTRSDPMVTRVTFVLLQNFYITHADWSWREHDLY